MNDIWIKHKLLVIILSYALAFAAAVYFLAVPLINKITAVSDMVQEKIIDKEMGDERIGRLPQMEEDWSKVELRKDSLDVILVPDNELGFIENVELIAEKTGNIISLKIGENADSEEIAKIKRANNRKDETQKGILDEISYASYFPIQISLKGDYNAFWNFIHMFENSQFYANVISIEAKKIILDEDSSLVSGNNLFSSSKKPDEKRLSKKEIIITNINAIVYTKKQ